MPDTDKFQRKSRHTRGVWASDGNAHAWTTRKGDGELHYENQTGNRWSVKVNLRSFDLRGLSISGDGRFVAIGTGYHSGIDAEENLQAYDMNGQCVYSVYPPDGAYFAENATQMIADILATGDPDGVLVEKNVGLVQSINYYSCFSDQIVNTQ
jgi:hypothetical protein